MRTIEVELTQLGARRFALRYVVSGNIEAIEMPRHTAGASRADELWRHTCFEAFLRVGERRSYHEFNFAPSGEWNAYRLADYRQGMVREPCAEAPDITTISGGAVRPEEPPLLVLTATIDLERTLLPTDSPWHIGLSAIIEERNGTRSYWALKHPPGEPDFHHPDCFHLELPAARPV
ncbi:DOMON-like domain-containing protein [Allosphingosinicella deserti]|uniref:DOMON-like domain-containing protein n=1 Tax=Allosphingosinicella deserti TaxID=2116704 RepID=UPI0011B22B73|nr:DOMON-like domain-containing protein [Sphingomonas deserti]